MNAHLYQHTTIVLLSHDSGYRPLTICVRKTLPRIYMKINDYTYVLVHKMWDIQHLYLLET